MHRCPLYENPPFTMLAAASFRSASAQTIATSLPPSSIWIGIIAALRAMARPVSPPVKEMALHFGCVVM